MTEKRSEFYARETDLREALIRCGEASAALGLWRDLQIAGGAPTVCDGEVRPVGAGRLVNARESLRSALEHVEALILRHPDVLPQEVQP